MTFTHFKGYPPLWFMGWITTLDTWDAHRTGPCLDRLCEPLFWQMPGAFRGISSAGYLWFLVHIVHLNQSQLSQMGVPSYHIRCWGKTLNPWRHGRRNGLCRHLCQDVPPVLADDTREWCHPVTRLRPHLPSLARPRDPGMATGLKGFMNPYKNEIWYMYISTIDRYKST